jgi:hypothetical protein
MYWKYFLYILEHKKTCIKTGSSAVRSIGQQFITNSLDAVTLNFATLKAQFLCRQLEND